MTHIWQVRLKVPACQVTFSISSASTLEEIVQASSTFIEYGFTLLSTKLNGMDCKIIYGPWNTDPMAALFGGPAPSEGYLGITGFADMYAVFAENQGVILSASIIVAQGSTEYPEGTALVVMSGLWPYQVLAIKGVKPFAPIKNTNPVGIHKQFLDLKTRAIAHAGLQQNVDTRRSGQFGDPNGIVRNLGKLRFCLEKLKEISGALKKDMKYADYAAELIKIHRILSNMINPVKPIRS